MAAPFVSRFSNIFHHSSRSFPVASSICNTQINSFHFIKSSGIRYFFLHTNTAWIGSGFFNIARPVLPSRIGLLGRQSFHRFSSTAGGDAKRRRGIVWAAGILGGLSGVYIISKAVRNTGTLEADGNLVNSEMRLKYKPNRKIRSDIDSTGLKLTLYQYQTCPFCTKVRAYLDYRGLSYDVIEVNSVRRNQIKWSKYQKVPILVLQTPDGKETLQLNDSSVIISTLESFLMDPSQSLPQLVTYYPELETENSRGKKVYEYPNKYFLMYGRETDLTEKRKEEQKWRQWSDDVLVHALSPNIYLTPSQSLEAFRSFSEAGEWEKTFNTLERWFIIVVGASAMFFVGKILKKRHNLKDDVRESLYEACNSWTDAVTNRGKFLGGDEPNLADLAIYGELNAIEGCQAFRELKERNPRIASWYSDTKKAIHAKAGHRLA